MRRAAAMVAVTLGLMACGGDDDADDGAAALPEASETTEASEPDEPDDSDESAEGDGSRQIDSLDDIPDRCKDLMADFLRDIEPIVEPVDWSSATLADFEAIGAEFEARAGEFDTEATEAACGDLAFTGDDDGFALLIEFADDVAPDTVPFFQFLDSMRSAVTPGGSGGSGGDSFESCDDAIATLEEWMAEYDSFTEIPVDQLMKFSSLGSVIMTCTPEQMEFLDRPDVSDFMSGG